MATLSEKTASFAEQYNLDIGRLSTLIEQAQNMMRTGAYCPYSKFRVGAAVLSSSSIITTGANVENASYPVGICAERCAIAKAVVDGHRSLSAIAVSSDTLPPASPCGMCRQFMREFFAPDTPIFLLGKNDSLVVVTMEELLPMGFGPEMLGVQSRGDQSSLAIEREAKERSRQDKD